MNDFNLEVPLNNLSFGQVSYNILTELFRLGLHPNIFVINKSNPDLTSYKQPEGFKAWLDECVAKASSNYKRSYPTLRLWHLMDSEKTMGNNTALMTFHELDQLTPNEANIAANQKTVFVTSDYTANVFKTNSSANVKRVDLGFDAVHFRDTGKNYLPKTTTVWQILGKAEKRKGHERMIKCWLMKYGNNPRHVLHLSIYNPFFTPEQNNQVINSWINGQYFNVNVLPFVQTNESYNDVLNACNIVLGVGQEGWGLGEFQCVGLGKHALLGNWAGYQSWANEKNAVMLNKSTIEPCYDDMFFRKGQPYNQGNLHVFDEDEFIAGLETVEKRYKNNPINEEGLKIQTDFTWEKTTKTLLDELATYV